MKEATNTVHLWKISLQVAEKSLPRMFSLLDTEEQKKANQFLLEKHRRRFIVSHAALRNILAAQLNTSAAEVDIQSHKNGKPFIQGTPLHFNLSHSEEMALVAISTEAEVGVDIEYVKNDISVLEIAKRFFHPDEFTQLKKMPIEKHQQYFYFCWTAKEAYLKAKGFGIANHLNKFSLNFQDPEQIKVIFADKELDEIKNWFVHSLSLGSDYIATVVCTRADTILKIHHTP